MEPDGFNDCFYRSILDAVPEMVLAHDGNNKVVYINKLLSSCLGIDGVDTLSVVIQQLKAAVNHTRGEVFLQVKTGEIRRLFVAASSIVESASIHVHTLMETTDKRELITKFFNTCPIKMGISVLKKDGGVEDEIDCLLANDVVEKYLDFKPVNLSTWHFTARDEFIQYIKASRTLGYVWITFTIDRLPKHQLIYPTPEAYGLPRDKYSSRIARISH
jgi:hypothetical protein